MADYISGYTGAEIDLSVSSGSTKSGKVIDNTLISGSSTSTGSFGHLSVVGNAIISGNLTIGDSVGDSVAFVADLSSSLIPDADGGFNLGSAAKQWQTAYIKSGSLDSLSVQGNTALGNFENDKNPQDNVHISGSTRFQGNNTTEFGNLYVDGTGIRLRSGTSTPGTLTIRHSDNEFIVGSMVNSSHKFTVSGSIHASGTLGTIVADKNISGSSTSTGSFGRIETRGTISSSGTVISDRVFIGSTTAPFTDDLHLGGNAGYSVQGWRVGTASTYVGKLHNSSGVLELQGDGNRDIRFGGSTPGVTMFIDTSAHSVGIGTDVTSSLSSTLTVSGSIHVSGSSSTTVGNVIADGNISGSAKGTGSFGSIIPSGKFGGTSANLGKEFQFEGNVLLVSSSTSYVTSHAAIRRGGDGSAQIDAPGDVVLNIDTNNNETDAEFKITKDASVTSIFKVGEDGNVTATGTGSFPGGIKAVGHISTSGNLYVSKSIFLDDGNGGYADATIESLDDKLNIKDRGSITIAMDSDGGGASGHKITFGTGSLVGGSALQSLMIISSSGTVGIGTTTPSKELEVDGEISASGAIFTEAGVNFEDSSLRYTFNNLSGTESNGRRLGFLISSGSSVLDSVVKISGSSDGNAFVMIGGKSTTPLTKALTVVGDISASGGDIYLQNNRGLKIERADGTSQDAIIVDGNDDLVVGHGNLDDMILTTDDGEAVRIKGDGKVGIGTTSPSQVLTVSGSIHASGSATSTVGNIIADGNISGSGTGSFSNLRIITSATGAPAAEFNGTNPSIRIKDTDNNVQAVFSAPGGSVNIGSSTNHAMKFQVNAGTKWTIGTDGNFTGPGSISASSDLFLGDVGAGGNTTFSASMSTVTASLEISGGFADVRIQSLPTSDPGVAGQIWSNSGVLTVSSG